MKVGAIPVIFIFLNCVCKYVNCEETNCSKSVWLTEIQNIQNKLDLTVSPCDDFYEYACGNWFVPYKVRALNATDVLTAAKAYNKRLLMQYMSTEQSPEILTKEQQISHAVVIFYNSCIEQRFRDTKNKPMMAFVNILQQFSTWPIINSNFAENSANISFNWEDIGAQLRLYGVQSFMRVLVQSNWQASDQDIFYITAPTFDLLKKHQYDETYDDDTVYLYKRYVKYLMLDLGVRVRRSKEIAEEVVEFEKELLRLTTNSRDIELNAPQTLKSLIHQLPEINLRKYFSVIFQNFTPSKLIEQELLVVADLSYMRKLADLLRKSSADIIGKYLLVQFLAHFEVNLHDDDMSTEYKDYCLQQVNTYMPNELSKLFLYLQHNNSADFLKTARNDLTTIFDQLKNQFEKAVNATNIFDRDPSGRMIGLEKLRAMQLRLPVLQENEIYDFQLTDNYYENIIYLSKFKTKKLLKHLMQVLTSSNPNDISVESNYGPLNVNAYYRLTKNIIEIPVGILRSPFYNNCFKSAHFYGSFIYIIAHEFLHGFDYDGLNYDQSGNVTNAWNSKSIIQFGIKSQCYLSERYKNAIRTVNENIADSEGLRLAYDTFRNIEGPAVLTEDDKKLFFISFAQTWCGENNLSANSVHAGHSERVNNAVSNFPEFADAFACEAGSSMHPDEKCKIW
ncbi:endothelin-converting enzyme homolog [Teleopsis dalmanni]|uniref:endothelin-converting enzyme homolog n=1 Tax=Teleopsis dalmanni TaxID=139649 RepID=UPI0018CD438B|nr:endothelin-converting enzyme homolog [Teleopsis dalmanni]